MAWEIVGEKPASFDEGIQKLNRPECRDCTAAHILISLTGADFAVDGINYGCPGGSRTVEQESALSITNRLAAVGGDIVFDLSQPCFMKVSSEKVDP
jgi:hypothetical protein